jgi:acyl-coenzyme A synthetase/AMP-(fatty) acid ligase
MFREYIGDPAATVQSWRDLWFHTGDRARIDEAGWLPFVDRTKDAIRRRGENISSVETGAGQPWLAQARWLIAPVRKAGRLFGCS